MCKKNIAAAAALLGTLTLGQPVLANDTNAQEEELLSMLFSDDDLVEVATRSPKPMHQVAENVTIVTLEEIERMNAHNIDDVISRVAGMMVLYPGKDFNGNSFMYAHQSNFEHVTLLIDGIRVNKIWAEVSFANIIPIRIVKRIEIIKGAASSTWGSAMGGVINVITKDTGKTTRPTGSARVSYGEFNTHDTSGDVAGKVGTLGYYLSVSDQHSDGLKDKRYFDNTTFYAKLDHDLGASNRLSMAFSYSKPDYKASCRPLPEFDDRQEDLLDENMYLTTSLDSQLTDTISSHLSLYQFNNDYSSDRSFITTGLSYDNTNSEQLTRGVQGYLNGVYANHNMVVGLDYQRHELTLEDLLTGYEGKTLFEEEWGIYANDTITLGKFTITPGLRYDAISISDNMLNPSLGMTYRLTDTTLLRAIVSRGFRKVPIAYKQGDPYFMWAVNDNLEPETNWSYQLGVESSLPNYFRYKTTLFYHDAKDVWTDYTWPYANGGDATREGVELELSTVPVFDTWLTTNFTYTRHEDQQDETNHSTVANVILTYDNPEIFTLELAGRFIKYGSLISPEAFNGEDNNFSWDLSFTKKLHTCDRMSSELFVVAHNLFDEEQMVRDLFGNAPRWVEAGFKIYY